MSNDDGVEVDPERVARIRRVTARRTQQSTREAPHFFLDVDADMSAVRRLRDRQRADEAWEAPASYTAIFVHAVARRLAESPHLNATYSEDGPVPRAAVGIGVAVDTPAGLLVPVLPEANRLSLREIAEWLPGAAARARQLKLRSADLSEKSMVVSNLGSLGVDRFHAIIDPPDPMILAVGRTVDRVVAVDGRPVVAPQATLSLSIDHRVIDGADGARFLAALRDNLESIDTTGG